MSVAERVSAIEAEVFKLKNKSRDKWDKFSITCSALVPVTIAAVGGFYTVWSENTKTELALIESRSQEARRNLEAEQAQLRATAESKLKQAELVSRFFDALTGSNDRRREFAVNSLLVAAPDYGPVLVRVASEMAASPKAASYATTALDQRRDLLIRQMFGEDADLRRDAYNQLLTSWGSDTSLVPALIAYGTENKSNANGVYNVLVLLSHMQRDTILAKKPEIIAFTKLVEGNGSKTAERASILRTRLGG